MNCYLHNSVGEWGAGNWVIQVFFNSFVFQKDYIQVHVGHMKNIIVVIAHCNIIVAIANKNLNALIVCSQILFI